uniref:Uncharacterized protein n=1 Tax=Esox lucius TaxID=8010 RepID=A0AAY5L624_ESOLU
MRPVIGTSACQTRRNLAACQTRRNLAACQTRRNLAACQTRRNLAACQTRRNLAACQTRRNLLQLQPGPHIFTHDPTPQHAPRVRSHQYGLADPGHSLTVQRALTVCWPLAPPAVGRTYGGLPLPPRLHWRPPPRRGRSGPGAQ